MHWKSVASEMGVCNGSQQPVKWELVASEMEISGQRDGNGNQQPVKWKLVDKVKWKLVGR